MLRLRAIVSAHMTYGESEDDRREKKSRSLLKPQDTKDYKLRFANAKTGQEKQVRIEEFACDSRSRCLNTKEVINKQEWL